MPLDADRTGLETQHHQTGPDDLGWNEGNGEAMHGGHSAPTDHPEDDLGLGHSGHDDTAFHDNRHDDAAPSHGEEVDTDPDLDNVATGEHGGQHAEEPEYETEAPQRSRANKVILIAGAATLMMVCYFGYQWYEQTHSSHHALVRHTQAGGLHAPDTGFAALPTRPHEGPTSSAMGGGMSAPAALPGESHASAIESSRSTSQAASPATMPGTHKLVDGQGSATAPHAKPGHAEVDHGVSPSSSPQMPSPPGSASDLAIAPAPTATPALMKAIDSQGAMLKSLLKAEKASAAAAKTAKAEQGKEIGGLTAKVDAQAADIAKMAGQISSLKALLAKQEKAAAAAGGAVAAPRKHEASPKHEIHKAVAHHHVRARHDEHHVKAAHNEHHARAHRPRDVKKVVHHVDPNHVMHGWHLTMVSSSIDQIEAPNGHRRFVRPGEKVAGVGVIGHTVPYRTPAGVSSFQLFTSGGRILPKLGQ